MDLNFIRLGDDNISDINRIQKLRGFRTLKEANGIPKDWVVYGAYDGKDIVAIAALFTYRRLPYEDYENGMVAELGGLYTLEGYRRRGIMTQLLRTMMENVKNDCIHLDAVTTDANMFSKGILRKLGWDDAVRGETRLWINL